MREIRWRVLGLLAGLLASAWAGPPARADILVLKSGSRYEGTISESNGSYTVVRPDGSRLTLPKAMVAQVVRKPLPRPTSAAPLARPSGAPTTPSGSKSTVKVNFARPADDDSVRAGQAMEVFAIGVGTDADKAVQAAFTAAIQQAVGVLVDAETLIRNDELVSEKVLTFSRGFVEHYDVIKRWKADGLHHARIRARVSVDRLAEKLQAQRITVRKVPGELLYRQIKHELITEKNAAEMYAKAMADYDMTKLLTVAIQGAPAVVERDATRAKVKVTVKLTPNMANWAKFRQGVLPVLRKTAAAHETCQTGRAPGDADKPRYLSMENQQKIEQRLKGPGTRVYLLDRLSPGNSRSYWNVFLAPATFTSVLSDCMDQRYRLRTALLATDGSVVADANLPLAPAFSGWSNGFLIGEPKPSRQGQQPWFMVSPLFCDWNPLGGGSYVGIKTMELQLELTHEKLRRVAKAGAFVEQVPSK